MGNAHSPYIESLKMMTTFQNVAYVENQTDFAQLGYIKNFGKCILETKNVQWEIKITKGNTLYKIQRKDT